MLFFAKLPLFRIAFYLLQGTQILLQSSAVILAFSDFFCQRQALLCYFDIVQMLSHLTQVLIDLRRNKIHYRLSYSIFFLSLTANHSCHLYFYSLDHLSTDQCLLNFLRTQPYFRHFTELMHACLMRYVASLFDLHFCLHSKICLKNLFLGSFSNSTEYDFDSLSFIL